MNLMGFTPFKLKISVPFDYCQEACKFSFLFIFMNSLKLLLLFDVAISVFFSSLFKVLVSSGSSSVAPSMMASSFSYPTLFLKPQRIYFACFCTTDLFPLMLWLKSLRKL